MSTPITRSEDMRLYSATPFTGDAYVVTEGYYAPADLPADMITLQGFRGISALQAIGSGTANENFHFKVFGVWRITNPHDESADPVYFVGQLLSVVATLGTADIPEGAGVAAQYLVADTLVVTKATLFDTFVEGVYGRDLVTHSPADNTSAMLALPDLGNMHGFIIDVDIDAGGSEADAVNFLVARGT